MRILKIDTASEMGDESFIREVASFNSTTVFFFL